MALFGKEKYTLVKVRKKTIPDGLWVQCPECHSPHYKKTFQDNLNVCPKCNSHLQLTAPERVDLMIDAGTFEEHDASLTSVDPLKFEGPKTYIEKLIKNGVTPDAIILDYLNLIAPNKIID